MAMRALGAISPGLVGLPDSVWKKPFYLPTNCGSLGRGTNGSLGSRQKWFARQPAKTVRSAAGKNGSLGSRQKRFAPASRREDQTDRPWASSEAAR
jgi:hypothetical protein